MQVENQHRFAVVENMLIRFGYAPINPASDAVAIGMGDVTYDMLMEKDEALISKVDAVYLLPGHHESPGSLREVAFAAHYGVPCVQSLSELNDLFCMGEDA